MRESRVMMWKAIAFACCLAPCCLWAAGESAPGGRRDVRAYNGRPTPPDVIQVYAHRAVRGLLPEHTLPGYAEALRIGCDYVDMDVNMTRDGVLVVTHDQTLNPDLTTDATGKRVTARIPVNTLLCAELQRYNVGRLNRESDYGRLFPHQRDLDLASIPTLREVIRYVKGIAGDRVGFQIEIKTDPAHPELSPTPKAYATALHALLHEERVLDRTEIQAFDWRCLIELNRIDPKARTAYLTDRTTVSLTDAETGLWTAGLLPKDYGYSLPRMVKSLGGSCWDPFEMDLTKAALDEAHALGLKVVPWGWPEMEGNDFPHETITRLIAWGVNGIITDRPDLLRDLLSAKGYAVPGGMGTRGP